MNINLDKVVQNPVYGELECWIVETKNIGCDPLIAVNDHYVDRNEDERFLALSIVDEFDEFAPNALNEILSLTKKDRCEAISLVCCDNENATFIVHVWNHKEAVRLGNLSATCVKKEYSEDYGDVETWHVKSNYKIGQWYFDHFEVIDNAGEVIDRVCEDDFSPDEERQVDLLEFYQKNVIKPFVYEISGFNDTFMSITEFLNDDGTLSFIMTVNSAAEREKRHAVWVQKMKAEGWKF